MRLAQMMRHFQCQPMVILGSHCLASTPRVNDVTHNETLSQGTLHANFIYGYHQACHSFSIPFQQSCGNHCKFYDGIESWLEESYMSTFPMNYNAAKLNMLGRYLLESMIHVFDPSLLHFLQLTFDEHVVAGLELLDWLHWHYAFTQPFFSQCRIQQEQEQHSSFFSFSPTQFRCLLLFSLVFNRS